MSKHRTSAAVLVVDDEPALRFAVSEALRDAGYTAHSAASGDECFRALSANPVDIVLLDVRLQASNEDGQEILVDIVRRHPSVTVIMMTALDDPASVVRAMRSGAFDYITKAGGPWIDKLLTAVEIALADPMRGRPPENAVYDDGMVVTQSTRMRELLDTVRLVARSSLTTTVLIRGETGAGKEVIARALHAAGATSEGPFCRVEASVLSPTLLESELFGHVKGAFTGAHRDRRGLFEVAGNGTVFLDEIGDLPLDLQTKMLSVTETRTFRRVGSTEELEVHGRIVAATWVDLEELVRQGKFRQDLYHRLNVITLQVPPLRERSEDILPIARAMAARAAQRNGRAVPALTPAAEAALLAHDWPGNVRDVRNTMERAVIFSRDGVIDAGDLVLSPAGTQSAVAPAAPARPAPHGSAPAAAAPFRFGKAITLKEAEQQLIPLALAEARGNKTKAAEILGISRHTLHQKMQTYRIGNPAAD